MKNVFVAGGMGFIGSHLIRRLVSMPEVERIVAFDNESNGHRSMLPESDKIEIAPYDLVFYGAIAETMPGCDTVFHLAANPDISKSVTHPAIDFEQGTVLTQRVLEHSRLLGVERLFYTSGSGVYGDYGDELVSERSQCLPISTYGASKLGSEAMISSYCHMFGLKARAFRFANVVGPRQTHGVGYDFMRKLRDNPKRLEVLGNGNQRKSYIYIDDVLNAIFTIAGRDTPGYDVFNVATGDYITVREIARLAIEASGLNPQDVELVFAGGERGWKGDVPVVRFDCTKIAMHGWQCQKNAKSAIMESLKHL